MKICNNCKETKSFNNFYFNKDYNRYAHECKPCKIKRSKEWGLKNKISKHKHARKRALKKYNLTESEYDNLFIAQKGSCKICSKSERRIDKRTGKINNLTVDHCHKTGKVRGLLCAACNRSLGLLGDNLASLIKVTKYLQDFENSLNQQAL